MIYYFVFATLVTFIVYGADKWFAIKKKRRISEAALLLMALAGGSIGAIMAMIIFRHKVSKTFFLIKLGCVVAIQIVLAVLLMNNIFFN